MRVLLVGGGGREHALAWKLTQSSECRDLHAAPGNPGIARLGECHPTRPEDVEAVLDLCRTIAPDLVVVGPEAPLVAGLADELRHAGVAVFGPGASAARIEGSKSFAKDVMDAAGVPAARPLREARAPCVVKADGLTAGKGVFVCRNDAEVDAALAAVRRLSDKVVVEELLEGEEVSILALTDGVDVVPLPAARDYSRVGDGDCGPNTGGMGSYCPVAGVGAAEVEELVESVYRPVLAELARRDVRYTGCLYAGLMLTEEGPRVLEFNCRFGDPETQAILPLVETDLLDALAAAGAGDLEGLTLAVGDGAAVTVVLAAAGYPAESDRGTPVEGVDAAERAGALVFHAGTALREGRLVTNGGRILGVTATAEDLTAARAAAYDAANRISFAGARFRRDIALTAAEGARVG